MNDNKEIKAVAVHTYGSGDRKVTVTPAPLVVLVRAEKSTGGQFDGDDIAAKEHATNRGVVMAVGFTPARYELGLREGDVVTYGRFNAVDIPQLDLVAVPMQYIMCKERASSGLGLWARVKGWAVFGLFSAAFASGWVANDAWAFFKKVFRRGAACLAAVSVVLCSCGGGKHRGDVPAGSGQSYVDTLKIEVSR